MTQCSPWNKRPPLQKLLAVTGINLGGGRGLGNVHKEKKLVATPGTEVSSSSARIVLMYARLPPLLPGTCFNVAGPTQLSNKVKEQSGTGCGQGSVFQETSSMVISHSLLFFFLFFDVGRSVAVEVCQFYHFFPRISSFHSLSPLFLVSLLLFPFRLF